MTARIGVVGIGWWAVTMHIPTLQSCEGVDVAAICDLDAERLRVAGDRFGIAARHDDSTGCWRPNSSMAWWSPRPMSPMPDPRSPDSRGCHVLVEKPMATSARDARAIAEAAARSGRQVMVPTGLNFTRFSARAAQWVRSGRIGTLRHVVCQMGSPLDDLFAGRPMAETADHLFRPPPSTWSDPARAGGYGWGQLSHALAWVAYVTDMGLDCIGCLDVKSPTGVDYYDAAMGRFANGATFALSGASTVPKHVGMHTDVRLYGTEGMIHFSNLPARLELRRHDGQDEALPLTDLEGLYDGSLPVKAFARLCRGEAVENASDALNGWRVTAALDALYRAAASGRIEKVEGR
ncbi:putative dehydrogenase/related protein [Rubellimicrobium thermophilum DSM 16684]|uniref:Putative dehydrogenase/related protein n=1 Tax=Rubellimicrobium thermophilum DSM 16684 TaxID=1123069 RepID=S9QYG3_9RHOB|nr:Gfo/Idh/MocA family oxidoreductase [Rubellimicrobium thermophilum]EPX84668.1 putative dehydrogenase/related protein [Rubellimicrobium thermophilum DSM 16684]